MSRPALIALAVAVAVALAVLIIRTPKPASTPSPTSAPAPASASGSSLPSSRLPTPPSVPTIPTSADPATLGVRTEVLRTLDRLSAPVAIHDVVCTTPSLCDVTLEAKTRDEAAFLIDRLSEPQSGLSLDYKSMKLHAVTEDPETHLVRFGFTLER